MTCIDSLRARITAAFLLGALILGTLFYLLSVYFVEDMEEAYSRTRLSENMALILRQARGGEEVALPYSDTMRAYAYARDKTEPPRAAFVGLAPGLHEIEIDGRELQIMVSDVLATRYILTYDVDLLEGIEEQLELWLIVGLAVMTCVSTLYGYAISSRIVRPITTLANAVDSLEGQQILPPAIARGRADDEVERLRRAFQSYSTRLHRFIERERNFTADVSHELRNPVMVAMNAVELLESRRDLDPRANAQVERLRRAAERMAQLIELFLELSREAEPRRGGPGGFDIAAATERVVDDFRDAAAKKGLGLVLTVNSEPEGSGDELIAAVVLENVLENAVQYTVAGSIRVVVEDGGVVVADSGPGMRDAERASVMSRFVRGTAGQAHAAPGFGLGLSIVSRLCEHQGWSFELDCGEASGTRATLVFRSDPRHASHSEPG